MCAKYRIEFLRWLQACSATDRAAMNVVGVAITTLIVVVIVAGGLRFPSTPKRRRGGFSTICLRTESGGAAV